MRTPSFPSQEFCLSCQGCCRFQDSRSPWRPKVYAREEKFFSTAKKILRPDGEGFLEAKCVQGFWLCEHLEPKTNRCQAYPWRPFECALYPFLLVRQGAEILLAVHDACPFVQEKKDSPGFAAACRELSDFFAQQDAQKFLTSCRDQVSSAHIKPEEIRILFSILAP